TATCVAVNHYLTGVPPIGRAPRPNHSKRTFAPLSDPSSGTGFPRLHGWASSKMACKPRPFDGVLWPQDASVSADPLATHGARHVPSGLYAVGPHIYRRNARSTTSAFSPG